MIQTFSNTVIPRLTKIIRSGITFVSRNLRQLKLLAVSNVNNAVVLVCLPFVMWSAHFFVTNIQTEKISSWNGPTVCVCCFMLARASTKTFVSRIHIRQPSPKNSEKNIRQPKNLLAGSLVSRGITVFEKLPGSYGTRLFIFLFTEPATAPYLPFYIAVLIGAATASHLLA